jgi:hypothetical protein
MVCPSPIGVGLMASARWVLVQFRLSSNFVRVFVVMNKVGVQ